MATDTCHVCGINRPHYNEWCRECNGQLAAKALFPVTHIIDASTTLSLIPPPGPRTGGEGRTRVERELCERNDDLARQLHEERQEVADLSNGINFLEEVNQGLHGRIESLEAELTELVTLRAQLAERERTIAEADEKNAALLRQNEFLHGTLADECEITASLRGQLGRATELGQALADASGTALFMSTRRNLDRLRAARDAWAAHAKSLAPTPPPPDPHGGEKQWSFTPDGIATIGVEPQQDSRLARLLGAADKVLWYSNPHDYSELGCAASKLREARDEFPDAPGPIPGEPDEEGETNKCIPKPGSLREAMGDLEDKHGLVVGVPDAVPSHCTSSDEQRISFAYGNVAMHNPNLTKQDVIDAAERLKAERGDPQLTVDMEAQREHGRLCRLIKTVDWVLNSPDLSTGLDHRAQRIIDCLRAARNQYPGELGPVAHESAADRRIKELEDKVEMLAEWRNKAEQGESDAHRQLSAANATIARLEQRHLDEAHEISELRRQKAVLDQQLDRANDRASKVDETGRALIDWFNGPDVSTVGRKMIAAHQAALDDAAKPLTEDQNP